MIKKCTNPPKDSEKRRKSVRSNEKGNPACNNSDDDNDDKMYAPSITCLSATSMNLSVSSNDPGMKYVTYGVIWHVAPESKIQLVNCELSP